MSGEVAAALVAAAAATIGSVLTLWANTKAEKTKLAATETTADLERLKVQMDAWPLLLENYRQEIERLNEENARLRRDLEALRKEIRELRRRQGG